MSEVIKFEDVEVELFREHIMVTIKDTDFLAELSKEEFLTLYEKFIKPEVPEVIPGQHLQKIIEDLEYYKGPGDVICKSAIRIIKKLAVDNQALNNQIEINGSVAAGPRGAHPSPSIAASKHRGEMPFQILKSTRIVQVSEKGVSFDHIRDTVHLTLDELVEMQRIYSNHHNVTLSPKPKEDKFYSDTHGRWFNSQTEELIFGLGLQQQQMKDAQAKANKIKGEYTNNLQRLGEGLEALLSVATKFVPELKSIMDETQLMEEDTKNNFHGG